MNVPQGPCGFSSPGVCFAEAVKCCVTPSCVGSARAVRGNAAQVRKEWMCTQMGLLTGGEH